MGFKPTPSCLLGVPTELLRQVSWLGRIEVIQGNSNQSKAAHTHFNLVAHHCYKPLSCVVFSETLYQQLTVETLIIIIIIITSLNYQLLKKRHHIIIIMFCTSISSSVLPKSRIGCEQRKVWMKQLQLVFCSSLYR